MIIVSGWLHIVPGERGSYLASCHDVIEAARRSEGCLDFALSADPVDADRINVYERWATDADVDRFRGAGPGAGQLAAIRDADVARYRVAAVEPA